MTPLTIKDFFGLVFIHSDEARTPAIAEPLCIQIIQNSGYRRGWKTKDCQGANMAIAKHGLHAACKVFIRQDCIQEYGQFRWCYGVAFCGDTLMQVLHCLGIVQRFDRLKRMIQKIISPINMTNECLKPVAPSFWVMRLRSFN